MSLYRNAVWIMKGLSEYTHSGYTSASKQFEIKDLIVDLHGKSYIITGANSGIGKHTAWELAKRGGTIHMVCRNPVTAEEAQKELIKETGNKDIHVHILDLAKTRDVISFTEKFSKEQTKLDALVNNAGCMINTREQTEDGFELNFATNTLGTYAITRGLEQLLRKAPDPRVVTVSSGGMLVQKLNVDDLQQEKLTPFDGTMAYAQNKRQQVVMTEWWSDVQNKPAYDMLNTSNNDIKYFVMHPGWADTPAVKNAMPDFHRKMRGKLRSVSEGADTIVWLVASEAAGQAESGLFWQDRKPVPTHLPLAWTKSNQGDEKRLMDWLQDMMRQIEDGN